MKLRRFFFGAPKSPLDPHVFERLALAAFFAWVGLGADGLSSSCYGPAFIFEELHKYNAIALAPFLILAVVVTVTVLSAGYSNTIAAFPGGGGAYIVATKTLGRYPGLICGCALVVDYALTIAVSMASGIAALSSGLKTIGATGSILVHLPPLPYKLIATVLATAGLIILNLRGVKESIKVLLPIFLGFIMTHLVAIAWALLTHVKGIGPAMAQSASTAHSIVAGGGYGALLLILVKAYTAGAGTYTGIEAVSNSVPILREPRVATARRTMLYMAVSLAFTCGGLLMGYLLYGVEGDETKTLNAVFLERLTAGSAFGAWFVPLTLLTEGLLLFVAAQAGYVDGPRVMASMAIDSWVPRWFRHLSDRLVISNGILLVGVGAIGVVLVTGGSVEQLVLIYTFSVFVTFVLSQLGMCVYHLKEREPGWGWRLCLNGAAFVLSAIVVTAMVLLHFKDGAWLSGLVIAVFMVLCILIRRYYDRIGALLRRLDHVRVQVEAEPAREGEPAAKNPAVPTAVVLVRGYGGSGIHAVMTILRLFPNYFRNFIFVSVGDIDFDRFKGAKEVEKLKQSVEADLDKYVALVRKWGFYGERRYALGVDVVDEVVNLCAEIPREFPRSMFFAGHLVFEQPTLLTRFMHEQTAEEIQRRLHFKGLAIFMLPIRVMELKGRA